MTLKTPDIYNSDFKTVKIGLCQIHTEQWMIDDNFDHLMNSLEVAAQKGADIAVTPECVLHGYADNTSDDYKQRMLSIAEPANGRYISQVCDKAKELNIYVLVGFAELGSNNKVYNSAALISSDGKILDVYRKVHCRDFEQIDEGGVFTPGDEFKVKQITIDGLNINIGTMICFDREIPETVRVLRGLGAQLVLCPLATNTSDMSENIKDIDNEVITRCRAVENEVFITVVNHAGRFNGGSFIVGPSGERVCQMNSEPGVHVQEIPIEGVATCFHSDPLGWMGWGYRRIKVYRKYFK